MTETYYKIWRHDYRSPVQSDAPQVWDGSIPFTLPAVDLDTSSANCGAGWNSVTDLAAGFRLAGLWPSGRPSIVTVIEPTSDVISRGDKHRSSGGVITRLASYAEIAQGITDLSAAFGAHAKTMADSQIAWRTALGRPERDPEAVAMALRAVLGARTLDHWRLRRFASVWDTRAAWNARAALTWQFAALMGRLTRDDDIRFITGLRDAYACGLAVVFPTGTDDLGYVLEAKDE